MPLELWIVLALVVIAGIAFAVARLRRKRRTATAEDGSNIYPLF